MNSTIPMQASETVNNNTWLSDYVIIPLILIVLAANLLLRRAPVPAATQ